jgi:hypothetical protein
MHCHKYINIVINLRKNNFLAELELHISASIKVSIIYELQMHSPNLGFFFCLVDFYTVVPNLSFVSAMAVLFSGYFGSKICPLLS